MTNEQIDKTFAQHEITLLGNDPRWYRCARPTGGEWSFNAFFPERGGRPVAIGLMGDVRLNGNAMGVWSNFGYGIGWFTAPKSPDYLAEKFLPAETHWEPEWATKTLQYWLAEDYIGEGDREAIGELLDDLDSWEGGWESFGNRLLDIDPNLCDDGVPGCKSYHPRDVAWLAGVQRCFQRLYHADVVTVLGSAEA